MTAKLRVELENATKKGFDEIVKDLEKMGVEGKDTEKVMEQLNKEMGSRKASELAKQVKELADEYDGTTTAAKQLDAELRVTHDLAVKSSKAMEDLSDSTQRAARSAGKSAEFQRDLQQALNERKVKAYRDEINKLADAMSGAAAPASKLSRAMATLGEVGKVAGAGLLAAGVALKLAWEGAKKFKEAVDAMAERGNRHPG